MRLFKSSWKNINVEKETSRSYEQMKLDGIANSLRQRKGNIWGRKSKRK